MTRTRTGEKKVALAFGETLWDLLPKGPVLGGAPFNFAFRMSGLGERSLIVTRLGRDERGAQALEKIADLQMETGYVQADPDHPTGTVQVRIDSQGNPDFLIVPGAAYEFIELTQPLVDLAAQADCFCFGTLVQRAEKTRHTLYQALEAARPALKLLDINLRKDCFTPTTIETSLQYANILKLNLQEAHFLAELFEISDPSLPGFCEEMIRDWDLSHCLVTLGEHGVFAMGRASKALYEPGYRVPVADTCGSGDAFTAGFIHPFLRHKPLQECCHMGNILGAMVAMQHGATTSISPHQIEQFGQRQPARVVEPTLQQFLAN